MKASELMIGDWAHLKYRDFLTREVVEFDFKVSQLPCNYGNEIQVWGDSIDGKHHGNMGDVSRIDPIPLTPKILEKNGFISGEFYAELLIGDWQIKSDCKGFAARNSRGWLIDIPCEYVHELQQALRLCGIDKEIEL